MILRASVKTWYRVDIKESALVFTLFQRSYERVSIAISGAFEVGGGWIIGAGAFRSRGKPTMVLVVGNALLHIGEYEWFGWDVRCGARVVFTRFVLLYRWE